jgi:hypothetical protein
MFIKTYLKMFKIWFTFAQIVDQTSVGLSMSSSLGIKVGPGRRAGIRGIPATRLRQLMGQTVRGVGERIRRPCCRVRDVVGESRIRRRWIGSR